MGTHTASSVVIPYSETLKGQDLNVGSGDGPGDPHFVFTHFVWWWAGVGSGWEVGIGKSIVGSRERDGACGEVG